MSPGREALACPFLGGGYESGRALSEGPGELGPSKPLMENDLLNGAALQLAQGLTPNGTPGAALGG